MAKMNLHFAGEQINKMNNSFKPKYEIIRDGQDVKIGFGQYSGRTLSAIWESNPEYISWMYEKDAWGPEVHKICEIYIDSAMGEGIIRIPTPDEVAAAPDPLDRIFGVKE